MIPRVIRRRIRPLWLAAAASAAWMNRKDVMRWVDFAKRAYRQRRTRPLTELLTEAKARMAVSADPVLRRDPALQDLALRDGVLTLLTNTPAWPDSTAHIRRLKQVRGVADVKALQVASR
jgi:hypothetical protein